MTGSWSNWPPPLQQPWTCQSSIARPAISGVRLGAIIAGSAITASRLWTITVYGSTTVWADGITATFSPSSVQPRFLVCFSHSVLSAKSLPSTTRRTCPFQRLLTKTAYHSPCSSMGCWRLATHARCGSTTCYSLARAKQLENILHPDDFLKRNGTDLLPRAIL